MRDDTSKGTGDEPSSRRLPAALLGELAALRHSVTELGASPATMSPSHADQLASVLAALGLATGQEQRCARDASTDRSAGTGGPTAAVTIPGGEVAPSVRRAPSRRR
jgi:hypothetical protein